MLIPRAISSLNLIPKQSTYPHSIAISKTKTGTEASAVSKHMAIKVNVFHSQTKDDYPVPPPGFEELDCSSVSLSHETVSKIGKMPRHSSHPILSDFVLCGKKYLYATDLNNSEILLFTAPERGIPPNTNDLFNEAKQGEKTVVRLNLRLLKTLIDSLSPMFAKNSPIAASFEISPDNNGPVRITAKTNKSTIEALIMPLRTDLP